MKNKVGLIKRLGILALLLACLGFVTFTPNTQAVSAIPCCSSCPLPPPLDPEYVPVYCASQCQTSDRDCQQACEAYVLYCASHCDNGC
jgi:hypothetical protein